MQHHVIEHASQGVAGFAALIGDRRFDGFADGDTQAARGIGIFFQGIAAVP